VDGFAGQYSSEAGHALAEHIGMAFVARHLPRNDDVLRTGLHFLNETTMPALLPEIRRVPNYRPPRTGPRARPSPRAPARSWVTPSALRATRKANMSARVAR
jgi:hypothetical protein